MQQTCPRVQYFELLGSIDILSLRENGALVPSNVERDVSCQSLLNILTASSPLREFLSLNPYARGKRRRWYLESVDQGLSRRLGRFIGKERLKCVRRRSATLMLFSLSISVYPRDEKKQQGRECWILSPLSHSDLVWS